MNEPELWELRVGVVATTEQADELMDRLAHLLCPDPDHEPPCPIPWSLAQIPGRLLDEDARAVHDELFEQAEIEAAHTRPS